LLSAVSEIEHKLVKWIESEKWQFAKGESHEFVLCYFLDFDADNKFTVAYDQDENRFILTKKLDLPKGLLDIFNHSPRKLDFINDLNVKLLFNEIKLKFEPNVEEMNTIVVFHYIYHFEFNKRKFVNSVYKMAHALEICRLLWRRFTDEFLNG
jgi:hypothetical protein